MLVLDFVFSHYLFASTTAHIGTMMFAFLSLGAVPAPGQYLVLFLLMMTLTRYATGTSPITFGSGYVTMGLWWKLLGYW